MSKMYKIGDKVSVYRKVYNSIGCAMFRWEEAEIINRDYNDEYFPYRVRFNSDRDTDWVMTESIKKISGIKV